MVEKMCPKCGALSSKKTFFKTFCIDCYIEDHSDFLEVDNEFELLHCTHCGNVRIQKRWVLLENETICDYVKAKVHTSLDNAQIEVFPIEKEYSAFEVFVSGTLGGEIIEFRRPVTVLLKNTCCDVCSKLSGNYYEALFQVRGTNKPKMKKAVEFIEKNCKSLSKRYPKAFICYHKKVRDGIDIFVGCQKAAHAVITRLTPVLHPEVKESWTLIGMTKDGKKKNRVTYSVRF